MPAFWAIAGNPGELALLEEEKDSGRYFLHMKKATVINEYYGKAGNTLITFRHRGSGSVTISWWLYEVKNGQRKHQKGIVLGKFAGSDDWKLEKLDVELPQADLVKLAISVDGEADIDAISVTAKLK